MKEELESAWCAGFFDGEGSSLVQKNSMKVQILQVNREALDRVCLTLGGKVYGPYGPYKCQRQNSQPFYLWCAYGRSSAKAMRQMWPYLGQIKKQQYIDRFREYLH